MTRVPLHRRNQRRGVVLILILAMLGLLAVIGVMFATLSGQTQLSGRYAAEAARNTAVTADETLDWGLEQLINDTENPASALRGHSLKRDMYGNDAQSNGLLRALPNGAYLSVAAVSAGPPLQITTNIPYNPPGVPELANKDFRRWTLRLNPQPGIRPAQTFEVIGDAAITVNGTTYHQLALTPDDFANPTAMQVGLAQIQINATFVLDCRYVRAFNGTGMNPFANVGFGQLANFRYNGLYNVASTNGAGGLFTPDDFPMDEDYDAVDLDNWFLAIRSADGSVVVPSFHRPGILTAADWTNALNPSQPLTSATNLAALRSMSKIMRPRAVDHPKAGTATFPNLVPDPTTGKIGRDTDGDLKPDADGFDVDNDGDGYAEGVWLDLGSPAQTGSDGKQYKPLFSFTVVGLNGKLPMNTAGNLNLRSYTSSPVGQLQVDHASHRGHSPSEINPKYAFASPNSWTAQATTGVSYGTFQLQKLLQGALDAQTNQPIQGRWGEAELLASAGSTGLFPRPGWTALRDDSNDSYTTYDFYQNAGSRPYLRPYTQGMNNEAADSNDGSGVGGVMLPAERFRNFLVPLDTTGNGRVMGWQDSPGMLFNQSMPIPSAVTLLPYAWGQGSDTRGRSGYFMHFRPPGMPLATTLLNLPPSGPQRISENRHNLTHGYESWRNPIGPNATPALRQLWGAMPWNYNPTNIAAPMAPADPRTAPNALPTMVGDINSGFVARDGVGDPNGSGNPYGVYGLYPGIGATPVGQGSIDRDNPDEMNHYLATQLDAPFTPADLEWMMRAHDVDGQSLSNRLGRLIPEAFTQGGADGTNPTKDVARYHRDLFSTDTWDLNTYSWANDNPGAGYDANSSTYTGNFAQNSRFSGFAGPTPPGPRRIASPSFPAMGYLDYPSFAANNPDYTSLNPALNNPPASPMVAPLFATPAPVAHRGRRINLNFPLPSDPVSANNPIDPVRQKWIRETYQFLKVILPPKAIDTPEELAQLSQFVVNIVDFRDPDGTITKFVNTDVATIAATGTSSVPATGQRSVILDFAKTAPTASFNPRLVESDGYLVQYGMEYQPVAINETLAYCFTQRAATGTTSTGRFFLELVNTLTRDNGANTGVDGTASDLTLENWEIVVTREDGTNNGEARPDPYTGQLPYLSGTPAYRKTAPLAQSGLGMVDTAGAAAPIRALSENGGVSYQVLGYPSAGTGVETPPMPTPDAILRQPGTNRNAGAVTDILPVPPTGQQYYWVYLRRPATVTKPVQPDPAQPDYNPLVVVDSMRFPYIVSDGTPPVMMGGSPNPGAQRLWSAQRLQPFRGGQAVPNTEEPPPPAQAGTLKKLAFGRDREMDTTQPRNKIVDPTWAAYGFSQQIRYSDPSGDPMAPDSRGLYNPSDNTSVITQPILHTINRANANSESWDPMVFHDRDFESVAELLMVPACPPGLFTKQFVDQAAPQNENLPIGPHATGAYPNTPIGNNQPGGAEEGDRLPADLPHVYPYLPDKFFYSPDGIDVTDSPGGTPIVGGRSGAGWHKMMEFFEVTSPVLGAIGPVADGENRDWYREDLRPGQVNLNLVIDEAVFFGLIDDPRLNRDTTQAYAVPQVVTQVDAAGVPTATYPMGNRGYYDGAAAVMKPAFADFLKLRHANPNGIYGGGALPTQNVLNVMTNSAGVATTYLFGAQPEAPFHSLSYPDIRYTILRPADPQRPAPDQASPTTPVQAKEFDNGIMSWPRSVTTLVPPSLPRARLFQVPDASFVFGAAPNDSSNPASLMVAGTPPLGTTYPIYYPALSPLTGPGKGRPTLANPGVHPMPIPYAKAPTGTNLLLGGSSDPAPGSGATATTTIAGGAVATGVMTNGGAGYDPANPPAVIIVGGGGSGATGAPTIAGGAVTGITITNGGSGYVTPPSVLIGLNDRREHPQFRMEWLQKLMNLTTVRTHQYAVWVTVGYFEVAQPGDARLAQSNPLLAIDKLGPEIGAAEGRAVRHRSFLLLDRTRAVGFNPRDPGDFRDLIVHRRRIE